MGDVLCGYAGVSEWRYNAAHGLTGPVDMAVAGKPLSHFDEIVNGFPPTLGRNGELTDESVRFIMKAVQDRDDRMLRDPRAPAADHAFCFAIEKANDKYWIHGEACALGAVIVAWHTGQEPETLIGWLDRCRVKFRPRDMEISKKELAAGLEEIVRWMSRGKPQPPGSVMVREPVTGKRFEQCWKWLQTV
jgi:hypothetical protein